MPYRTLTTPEPEPPDPAVVAYGERAAADRWRPLRSIVSAGILLVLTVGALVALRVTQGRRLAVRWQEALACLDDGSEGFEARVRARQLAAIGDTAERRSAWPSQCDGPLRALAVAAEDVGHRVLASSARDLALVAGRADLERANLVPPTSRLIDDARRIGLGPIHSVKERASQPAVPLLSELSACPPMRPPPPSFARLACVVADDGRTIACGSDDVRSFWRRSETFRSSGRDFVLATGGAPSRQANDCATRATLSSLDNGNVGVWGCDAHGTFHTDDAGVGPKPPLIALGILGTKVVVVWAQTGDVGGIRMRIAERGLLAHAKTRVIVDDRAPGMNRVGDLSLIEGNGYALLLFKTANGDAFVLRLDANGEVSNIAVSYVQILPG